MWGMTFRIHGCESHCGRRKLSVVGEISLSLRQRFPLEYVGVFTSVLYDE